MHYQAGITVLADECSDVVSVGTHIPILESYNCETVHDMSILGDDGVHLSLPRAPMFKGGCNCGATQDIIDGNAVLQRFEYVKCNTRLGIDHPSQPDYRMVRAKLLAVDSASIQLVHPDQHILEITEVHFSLK